MIATILLLFINRPKKILKSYKRYWVSCKDLTLYLYKSREELVHRTGLVQEINLKGCEVTPDVNISQNKYCIKLDVLSEHSQDVYIIRCESVSSRNFHRTYSIIESPLGEPIR